MHWTKDELHYGGNTTFAAYCTEQVWSALATTLEYLHSSPEVFVREEFELPRKMSEGRAQG
ncbi:MAG: hypothetical protein AB1503_00030 [Bacillota bacterium]|nr:hypothetical protein [Bacillota bacterium]